MTLQIPSIILPRSYAAGTGSLASTETIADITEHTSIEFPVEFLQEKNIFITATELALAPAAIPRPLWYWVELSPYPSANNTYWPEPYPISAAYWAPIATPSIEVSLLAGAAGFITHPLMLPWSIHSPWARVVLQTPVPAALPTAYWVVQVLFVGNK